MTSLTKDLLPFSDAIKAMENRRVVLSDQYYGMKAGLARIESFTVSGLAQISQVEMVYKKLTEAMKNGESFAQWKAKIEAEDLGLPKGRLENIYRTNVQGAYARGRCTQHAEVKQFFPYLQYSAVNDSRTRPAHAAMHGFIAPADDPIWSIWRPPAGFQCRCKVIALSKRRAEAKGISTTRPDVMPDKGWDYDPCEGIYKKPEAVTKPAPVRRTRKAVKEKTETASGPIAEKASELGKIVDAGGPFNIETVEDAKRLGKKIFDELIPEDDLVKWKNEYSNPVIGAKLAETFRTNLREKLAETRPVGLKLKEVKHNGVQEAAMNFPSAWVAEVNKRAPVLCHKAQKGERAFATTAQRATEIKVRDGLTAKLEPFQSLIFTGNGVTATHELAHVIQAILPSLNKFFQTDHENRTAGDRLERMSDVVKNSNYGPNEMIRKDKYVNPYEGKEYNTSEHRNSALERMSMSYDMLLGTTGTASHEKLAHRFITHRLRETIVKDPDSMYLSLGLLFHWSP